MIKVEDLGEVVYGGAVTVSEWWDSKRIEEGKLASKDVLKKTSFYTYLGVGLIATLMSVMGWMPRYRVWAEKVSTGFFYDIPRFAYNMSKTLSAEGGSRGGSTAVKQAQRVMKERAQLGSGTPAARSYQPEFKKSLVW